MSVLIVPREQLVRQVKGLPPLPHTMMRVWQVIDNPASNSTTLAEAICADPSLVATLLKLANSASYGRSRGIQTIPEAITLLGFNVIKKMCMGTIVQVGLMSQGGASRVFDSVLFWRHCVGTGLAAEAIAEIQGLKIGDLAFSHGLLHDLGVLALDRCLPPDAAEHFAEEIAAGRRLMDVEFEAIGTTHPELGAELAAEWNFPTSLQDVILHHAEPRLEPGRELEVLVGLACMLTDQQEYCQCRDSAGAFEDARKFLGLSSEQINQARQVVMHRLVALAEAFEI
ncbi:MAG: HDOD domain-containing protein [Candidatus Rokubacteria bacterium]|nr:HDOD domain-containing protein [Candidatus Rokubacteria bacterium]MBI5837031.1 HDOD domain-containing protein [Candidatus Eisenbacteria bacterium]